MPGTRKKENRDIPPLNPAPGSGVHGPEGAHRTFEHGQTENKDPVGAQGSADRTAHGTDPGIRSGHRKKNQNLTEGGHKQ